MKWEGEFKVAAKPEWLEKVGGKKSSFYAKLFEQVKMMDGTKCIVMTPDELPTKKVSSFRASLQRINREMESDFWVKCYFDEDKGLVYVWKRPRLDRR